MASEYKATITYNDDSTYDVPLNGSTILTRPEVEGGPNNKDTIRSVVIYDSVTELNSTFGYNNGVTCVTIPSSVTKINADTFRECPKLTDVINDSTITDFNGFTSCQNLVSINMPQTVKTAAMSFSGNYSTDIAEVHINDIESCCGISWSISPGKRFFIGDTLVRNVIVPNSVTKIGDGAFSGCGAIETIVIPDTVTKIGSSAFSGCSNIKSIVIGSGATTVSDSAFSGCIPFYLSVDTRQALYAFRRRNSYETSDKRLLEMVIGDNVTGTLPEYIFAKYRALAKITIGSGVTNFNYNNFENNVNLISLTVRASSPPVGISLLKLPQQTKIYVPCNSVANYKSASGWSDYSSRIFGYDCNQ